MTTTLPPVEIRDDLVTLYAARIATVPADQWRMYGPAAFMVGTIREVWDDVKARGLVHADLRTHRAAWDAAVAALEG